MTSYYRKCKCYCTCSTWYGTYWIKYWVHITRYCTNITRYTIYITKFSNKATFYTPYPTTIFFIWRRHHYRWSAACIHGTQGHSLICHTHRYTVGTRDSHTCMSMELSLPVLMTQVCLGRDSNPDLPHVRRTLYQLIQRSGLAWWL